MTIVTQEKDLINYSAVKLITVYEGTYTNDDGASVTASSILAFDFNTEVGENLDDATESAMQIGIFTDNKLCSKVLEELIGSIAKGLSIFRVPQPDGSLT